ncbi:MAG: response regulator transcription factor [Actinomycetia bacterium]|nr:response regulator transcription factor [Actinomycetes bacterium]
MADRVMVVDDEQSLRELLKIALGRAGFEVETYADGEEALAAVPRFLPHAAVIDIMMPNLDGFELCRRLRQDPNIYILMLTARDAVADRVAGLEGGADDYMVKPFSIDELVARLRAGLRRVAPRDEALRFGPVVMNDPAHKVTVDGESVNLTAKEYELLRYLLLNPNKVLSKAQILSHVWGYDFPGDDNLVEVHISSLRDKLGDRDKTLIQTIRGFGYRLGD